MKVERAKELLRSTGLDEDEITSLIDGRESEVEAFDGDEEDLLKKGKLLATVIKARAEDNPAAALEALQGYLSGHLNKTERKMYLSITNHDCETCHDSGHCGIKHIARYFQAHPDEYDSVSNFVLEMIGSDTWAANMADAFDSARRAGYEVQEFLPYLLIMTGYVMGKGQQVYFPDL